MSSPKRTSQSGLYVLVSLFVVGLVAGLFAIAYAWRVRELRQTDSTSTAAAISQSIQQLDATQTAFAIAAVLTSTPIPSHTPLPPTLTYTPSSTPTVTLTGTQTPTLTATSTNTFTPTFTFTATYTPSNTATPTVTPSPSLTPSITPTLIQPSLAPTSVEGVNPSGEDDTLTVLLIGSDKRPNDPAYRTDVLVIVLVNKTKGTVNMLSLPRDLYVYIPDYGYDRINTASLHGDLMDYEGGGPALLEATIQYNLGITIDRYAKVNFTGFESIIDTLDGIDMVVDCQLQDYRLKADDLNPNLPANWILVTLNPGLHHMNGSTALWYARSRVTTSDFDRNRRHQMLLRAMWEQFSAKNLWGSIPDLWSEFQDTIETDLSLPEILSLVSIGVNLDPRMIESHYISRNDVTDFTTNQGAMVLKMRPAAIQQVVQEFLTPPTQNRLFNENPDIEIVNASGIEGMDVVAQQRLAWEGLVATINAEPVEETVEQSTIYDFTGDTKGSSVDVLVRAMGLQNSDVTVKPDPNRAVDYRIVLGQAYYPCTGLPQVE
ncbi:MAG: LCP family protein [Chloroflexi bacterium]|nr:LCP family protein [Chloroflexota bacterium]